MSMMPRIDNEAARRLFLSRHGLSGPRSGSGKGAELADVISSLGFVQLDSVNTVARAHDMILWARRQSYRPEALGRLLSRDRALFEHWTHDASTIPIAYFPYWEHRFAAARRRLADRWEGWQGREFRAKVDDVLAHVQAQGCVTSGEVGQDETRGKGGWWDWHPSKAALEYLWHTGVLSVVRRDAFRKVYDLTERVIPARLQNAHPGPEATVEWAAAMALDRLGFATSGEIAAFFALISPQEAALWCKAAEADGRIERIEVQSADGSWRKCYAWPGTVAEALALPPVAGGVRILSPFDPALRDRNRAERLFGFCYRIEIFVPAPKRQYGYYVFPVFEGTRAIGRIDAKADRSGGVLNVTAFWPEAGVAMGKGRLAALQAELARLARFAGCDRLDLGPGWLRA